MTTCVILHNMIIQSERDMNQELIYDSNQATVTPNINRSADFSDFIRNVVALRDSGAHFKLRDDLVRHLWMRKGASSTNAETNDDSS
ncbi:hypothetical protein PSTG_09122 [Puccinia striiformis f. sp. tritici PST-78]|uniref:Uncharacterized protein n=1 Tax=Puccinia striiformis f. sp. tritici PST-78 TaxID=1165861 RepID=A0A0L0VE37_9BASI|nr:hypothetical protein PSTG_09122 [Puccinia striiformis f. sp. tritici PST-78]